MNTSLHRSFTRAGLLVASALFCSLPGLLPAEETLSATARRFDETVEHEDSVSAAARIGAKFTTLAGSTENATALVTGLHDGTAVTLTATAADGTVAKTEFQPTTGKLSYENTAISLSLAQKSLANAGITAPTSDQLVAALNGGTVTGSSGTAATLTGVLTLRATGEGWRDIAKTLNVTLGRGEPEHADGAKVAARIGAKFTTLAGSSDNATALVTGLHDGTAVTLTTTAADGTVTTTQFQPATGKLGYGNTFISLALAQKSLANAGITAPSADQLAAALNGGSVTGSSGTAMTLSGVLTLRATGEGWGDIAKTLNVKLGRVVGDLRAANHQMERHDRPEGAAKTVRAESTAKAGLTAPRAETVARPEAAGRPAWAGRSNLPNPGQVIRAGRH